MRRIALLTALPLLAWPLLAGQEAQAPKKLVQVNANGSSSAQVGPTGAAPDTQAWVQSLTQSDLDQRELAFDRLVAEAPHNPALATWFKETAKGQGDLAWTARLAMKQMRAATSHPRSPLASPFQLDPFLGDPWAGFDSMFSHPRLDLDDLLNGTPLPGGPGFGGLSTSESVSIQSGTDGVKVEIRTKENGNEDVKVYEADSMELLLEQYPELKGKVGLESSLGDPFASPLQRLRPTPRRPVLGVYLDPKDLLNERLKVTKIQPGSLADRMGILPGDELLTMDGHPVGTKEDIANGLRAHKVSTPLTIRVLGSDGEERTLKADY